VPGIPAELEAVVQRMMKKSLTERYSRPIDVAKALEPLVSQVLPLHPVMVELEWPDKPPHDQAPRVAVEEPPGSEWGRDGQGPTTAGVALLTTHQSASPEHRALSGSVFPDLDLGPEPPLIEPRSSGVVPRSSTKTLAHKPLQVGLGMAFLFMGLIALVVLLFGRGLSDRPTWDDPLRKGVSGYWPIEVKGLGESSTGPLTSLNEAVRKAGGRPVSILIGKDDGPVGVRGTLSFARGRYHIQSQPGRSARSIRFDLSEKNSSPAIQVPNGTLKIEGLTILFDYGRVVRHVDRVQPAFDVSGNLVLRNCHLIARGRPAGRRGIDFRGGKLVAEGCVFEGFDGAAIDYQAVDGSEVSLRNCLFVPPSADGRLPGWVLRVTNVSPGSGEDTLPRLALERCTILGQGALSLSGFSSQRPLTVDVRRVAFQTQNLLMARAEEFPGSLRWSGEQNIYDVQRSWGVTLPRGVDGLSGAEDFTSWQKSLGSEEHGSRAQVLDLPIAKVSNSYHVVPVDYAPVHFEGGAAVGIEPSRVGPTSMGALARPVDDFGKD
jgi:hypothetical protein